MGVEVLLVIVLLVPVVVVRLPEVKVYVSLPVRVMLLWVILEVADVEEGLLVSDVAEPLVCVLLVAIEVTVLLLDSVALDSVSVVRDTVLVCDVVSIVLLLISM